MLVNLHSQLPGVSDSNILRVIKKISSESKWSTITGVFAYTTVGGLLDLLAATQRVDCSPSYCWLFGLDDCLTDPGAIELAQSSGHTLRVASLAAINRRFHPKVLHFSDSSSSADVLIIGSANLTKNGLSENVEAISLISAQTTAEATQLRSFAESLFILGTSPTTVQLNKYRAAYMEARNHQQQIAKLSRNVLGTSTPKHGRAVIPSSRLDPSMASICWIEVGKNTALGRELEIKAEQAFYFGLNPTGDVKQERRFVLSDKTILSLTFKYQANSMWRLQMSNNVPEVRRGLRPMIDGRLGRSPYVAVFERTNLPKTFKLRFIKDHSKKYRLLRKSAAEQGALGKTSSRSFGWS